MSMRFRTLVGLMLVLAILCSGVSAKPVLAAGGGLTILNWANGDTLTYDLPLLVGEAPGSTSLTIRVGAETIAVSVTDGRWRAMTPLAVGRNSLQITTSAGERYTFELVLAPVSVSNTVRLVYLMGSDSDGAFDAPVGDAHNADNAVRRLRLAGRILQSLAAELLYDRGVPRATFKLLTDATGAPLVTSIRSTKTRAELRAMTDLDIYYHFYDLLAGLPQRDRVKDLAIVADTHYDAPSNTLQAHLALGGDRLAIFGSSTFYSFPESVADIEAHFTDTALIEPYLFPEYGRAQQYWATFTTSIGAMLHEVGHSFGLSHPDLPQPQDVMYRGFDYLNRMAVTSEPGHGAINSALDIIPRWTDADVVTLQANPWFAVAEQRTGSGGPRFQSRLVVRDSPLEIVHVAQENEASRQSTSLALNLSWPEATWSVDVEQGELSALEVNPSAGADGDMLATTAAIGVLPVGDYHGKIIVYPQLGSMRGVASEIDVHFIVVRGLNYVYLPVTER